MAVLNKQVWRINVIPQSVGVYLRGLTGSQKILQPFRHRVRIFYF